MSDHGLSSDGIFAPLVAALADRGDVHRDPFYRGGAILTPWGTTERQMRRLAAPALWEYDRALGRLGPSPALDALAARYAPPRRPQLFRP